MFDEIIFKIGDKQVVFGLNIHSGGKRVKPNHNDDIPTNFWKFFLDDRALNDMFLEKQAAVKLHSVDSALKQA